MYNDVLYQSIETHSNFFSSKVVSVPNWNARDFDENKHGHPHNSDRDKWLHRTLLY